MPWLDQLAANPVPEVIKTQLVWEDLDSWMTPNDKFFSIAHFDRPTIDASTWKLEIDGLVKKPLTPDARRHQGAAAPGGHFHRRMFRQHTAFRFSTAASAMRAGPARRSPPILEEAGVQESGIEVVFWGTDEGEITLKDDIRDVKIKQNFARSMSLADAMDPNNILCYEMNGAALPAGERLPAPADRPGLVRHRQRQVAEAHRDPRPRASRACSWGATTSPSARKSTTARRCGPRPRSGRARLKSAPARVTRVARVPDRRGRLGRADRQGRGQDRRRAVEPATIDHSEEAEFAWKIWSLDWTEPVSRRAHRHLARDRHERQRPAGDGRSLDRQEAHLLGKQRPGHAATFASADAPGGACSDRLVDQSGFIAA